MAVISRQLLSGSTNGKNIKVAATATPGTTIHTATSSASGFDEIWLWAQNSDPSALKLSIEFGGTTAPDDLIEITIPGESGPILVVPGWVLNNSLVMKAFAATTNLIVVNGFVNRIL
jgi:hypothetical protein